MPTPSYKEVTKQRDMFRSMVGALSIDPSYEITTRPAIPFELRNLKETPRFVVFADIDDCRGANLKFGYDVVNGKVKRACKIRSSDVLLRARWFSGDELVFLLRGDPEKFIDRLRTAFKNEGLSITCAHTVYSGDIEADVRACAPVVQAHKTGYQT